MERAGIVARQADIVAALTLEVLKGTSAAFDSGKSLCACSYSLLLSYMDVEYCYEIFWEMYLLFPFQQLGP